MSRTKALGVLTGLIGAIGLAAVAQEQESPGPLGCDPAETEIRMMLGTSGQGHPIADAAFTLRGAINEQLDGRYCLSILISETPLDNEDAFAPVLKGEAELAAPFAQVLDDYSKSFRIFAMPFLFKNEDAAFWFQNSGPGQRLLRELRGSGLAGLAFWNAGMLQLASARPFLAPEDIDGAPILIFDDPVETAWLKTVGAKPQNGVPGQSTEIVYNGLVDGMLLTFSAMKVNLTYLAFDGASWLDINMQTHLLVANEEFWSSLPVSDRRAITRIVNRVTFQSNISAREKQKENREELEALEFRIWPSEPGQRDAWIEKMRPLWRRYAKQIGEDYLDAALRANL